MYYQALGLGGAHGLSRHSHAMAEVTRPALRVFSEVA
jgi:hypothetical protein